MLRIMVLIVGFLAAMLLAPAAAEETVCQEGTHAIYTAEGVLVSCEELIGTPESCPEGAEPGYLEDGTLAGCFTSSIGTEELCVPVGVDTDGDMLDDGCDPCPEIADCDADGFCDGLEIYLGTNPLAACPDDPFDSAWPLDIDNDGVISVTGDVLNFRGRIGAVLGAPNWLQRLDLDGDGAITVTGDVLQYRGKIGVSCSDAVGSGVLASSMCYRCIALPVGVVDLHAYGEFNWTIPFPWPIPDIVTTKYRMNLRVQFSWVSYFNIAGLTDASAWAEAWYPYEIDRDPSVIGTPSEDYSQWTVEAGVPITVFPGPAGVTYHIGLWVDFWMPGYWGGGASGFHEWWIHEE